MSPPFTPAANFVPSLDEVMEVQERDPAAVWCVQVAPLSVEV
jgi:hypothetical protein